MKRTNLLEQLFVHDACIFLPFIMLVVLRDAKIIGSKKPGNASPRGGPSRKNASRGEIKSMLPGRKGNGAEGEFYPVGKTPTRTVNEKHWILSI